MGSERPVTVDTTDSLSLPADGSASRVARRWVNERFGDHPRQADLLLLVSELVTNAALHARTESELSIGIDEGTVRVEVRDGSDVLPVAKHYSTTASTGRGLLLVDQLADRWGAEAERVGKVVWFELDLEAA